MSAFIDRLAKAALAEIPRSGFASAKGADLSNVLIDGDVNVREVIRAILAEARVAVTEEMLKAIKTNIKPYASLDLSFGSYHPRIDFLVEPEAWRAAIDAALAQEKP